MALKRQQYKTYPIEYKREVLKMVGESDRPVAEIARQLGIRRNQIYKWRDQMKKKAEGQTIKRGRPKKKDQSELSLLRQENERLKEENEILKKAEVFFANRRKSDTDT
ncbi:hypothetical protein MNBD_GAMMA12-2217 [hydrothermal vent metagenome]|uniref:Transposase n=1 Tax=hydrothermal vent metagenome TaxID=652676 RepID=A0A3B0YLJ9_9ZZZZ